MVIFLLNIKGGCAEPIEEVGGISWSGMNESTFQSLFWELQQPLFLEECDTGL